MQHYVTVAPENLIPDAAMTGGHGGRSIGCGELDHGGGSSTNNRINSILMISLASIPTFWIFTVELNNTEIGKENAIKAWRGGRDSSGFLDSTSLKSVSHGKGTSVTYKAYTSLTSPWHEDNKPQKYIILPWKYARYLSGWDSEVETPLLVRFRLCSQSP